MIGFADTAWEILSLAGVFALGLALIPRLSQWLGVPMRHGLSLYLWHSLFCLAYIWYSLNNPADAFYYYLESLSWQAGPMPGGSSVIFFNSILTQVLGFSYGGCFFVFNIIGTIGLIAFAGGMRETLKAKTRRVRQLAAVIPFLPGFSFWSTAIGKDSIAFFGVGLICWASTSPYRRLPAILVGVAAMFAVRPHMVAFLLLAVLCAFALENKGSFAAKLAVQLIIIPSAIAVAVVSINYLNINENLDADGIEGYVEQRQGYNTTGGSSYDISNSSVPSRLFTYGFRPFFFDASGIMGLVVSVENLVLLSIFLFGLMGIVKRRSSLTRFQRLFFLMYVAISWIALANITGNIGIAIRQKPMFTPMLLMLMLSYLPNIRLAPPAHTPQPYHKVKRVAD